MFDTILSRDEQTADIEADSENADAETDTRASTVDLSLLDDSEQSILGEPYNISPTGYERAAGTKALAHTETEGDVSGPFIRQMFENARQKPRQAVWFGYDDDPQEGFREAGIPFESMRRHLWVAGVSGSGKTTFKLNAMVQLAYGGHGFVYNDPKGKDSRQLLRMLPEDRLDDVIWIEPGSREHDRTVQMNFLELPDWVPVAERENAVEDRIENLKAFFETEGYINIETITETMGRAMLKSDEDYTIIDLYFILLNEDRREEFAEQVEDPFIRAFCREIAEMDDDTIRPILKRITSWVQNGVTRRIIACRESTIDFREIIEEDKIVIVRTPVTNDDIKRMTALGVIRNIWSAIQQRSYRTDKDPQPFFMFCDEFDDIVSSELDVDSMLARARSMWLSLTLSCQYPTQIKKEGEDVLDAMENNCDNIAAFKANKRKNARILMDRFRKYDPDVLLDTNDFEIWTQLPLSGGEYSGGVKLNTFAPYPPLRNEDAIDEIIEDSLERYGEKPLSDAEIQRDLKFGRLGDALNPENVDADNIPPERILECIYVAVAREYDDPDGTEQLSFDRVHEEFERRTGVEITQAKFSNPIEELDGEFLEYGREGESKVRLTDDGLTKLFEQDTGEAENAGGPEHRYILRECFKTFLGMGADAYLPSQGGEELPDGVADLPINPLGEAETDAEYQQLKAECQEEYGPLYDLSDGKDIAIEAETTTLKKPKQTLTNLRKAVEQGKKCVFACKDGSYDPDDFEDEDDIPDHTSLFEYWGRRGENVIFDTSGRGANITTDYSELTFVSETTDDGRIFYNRGRAMQMESGVGALRPDTSDSLQWRERSTSEAVADTEIVIEEKTDNGRVLSRFESPAAIFDASPEAFPAYYEYVDGKYVVHANGSEETFETKDAMTEDFKVIREPFIPAREFTDSSGDTRLPTEDDFIYIIYPDDNNDEYDGPQVYEHGEVRPLVADESNSEDSAETDHSTDEEAASTEGEASSQQATESDERDSENVGDGQVERTNAPLQCPDCEECNRWSADGRNGELVCENCGYMPEKQVRDEIRRKRDEQEKGTDDEQRESSAGENPDSDDDTNDDGFSF
jgi:hypothetical protein